MSDILVWNFLVFTVIGYGFLLTWMFWLRYLTFIEAILILGLVWNNFISFVFPFGFHGKYLYFNFILPFFRRYLLWYAHVCPSVRLSLSPSGFSLDCLAFLWPYWPTFFHLISFNSLWISFYLIQMAYVSF